MMLKLLVTMALMSAVSVAGMRSDHAATCTATDDTKCNAGFSLEADTCTACVLPAASVCGNGKEPTTAASVCPGNNQPYTKDEDSNGPGCQACGDGTFAAAGVGCTACRPNAATCNSLVDDTACKEGFSLETGDTCTACVLPAASVCGNGKEPTSAASVCPGNNQPYTKDIDSNGPGCQACGDGMFTTEAPGVGCTACRPNAATCTSLTADTNCKEGFSLETGDCTACVLPAAEVCGNDKEPTTAATVCPGNNRPYTKDTDSAGTGCAACAAGTFAHAGVGCLACRPNAATCNSLTDDTKCNAGFSLESGTCTACVLPAASVCGNGKEPTTAAIVCPPGNNQAYTKDTDSTGTGCQACVDGTFAAPGVGCTACVTTPAPDVTTPAPDGDGANSAFHGLLAIAAPLIVASLIVV